MNLKNTIIALIVVLFIFQLIVSKQDAKALNAQIHDNKDKINISVSTFSLYDISKHISENTTSINMILPFGVDAHSYEPSPKQVASFYDSDLVIYSGAGLEPWCKNFEFKHKVLDISKFVKLKELDLNHKHLHTNNTIDPHYWLDIDNMIRATLIISDTMIKLRPKNKNIYEKNKHIYINMLKKLDKDYKKQLKNCKLDTIIVNHNAYSYLSSKYAFNVESLSGISPDSQTNAKNMISLIEHVKKDKVSTIFFESFASDKAIKSIALEAKVSVESLQPLGNITADEAKLNLSYEDIMRINLNKISKALECK
ncbi:MAG: ABC transporter substrate-binding protein [Sulfurimonas sp.]|nr:MAG: ABC transporter substrate-binding protein [Sulfurimonas sp.]